MKWNASKQFENKHTYIPIYISIIAVEGWSGVVSAYFVLEATTTLTVATHTNIRTHTHKHISACIHALGAQIYGL